MYHLRTVIGKFPAANRILFSVLGNTGDATNMRFINGFRMSLTHITFYPYYLAHTLFSHIGVGSLQIVDLTRIALPNSS